MFCEISCDAHTLLNHVWSIHTAYSKSLFYTPYRFAGLLVRALPPLSPRSWETWGLIRQRSKARKQNYLLCIGIMWLTEMLRLLSSAQCTTDGIRIRFGGIDLAQEDTLIPSLDSMTETRTLTTSTTYKDVTFPCSPIRGSRGLSPGSERPHTSTFAPVY